MGMLGNFDELLEDVTALVPELQDITSKMKAMRLEAEKIRKETASEESLERLRQLEADIGDIGRRAKEIRPEIVDFEKRNGKIRELAGYRRRLFEKLEQCTKKAEELSESAGEELDAVIEQSEEMSEEISEKIDTFLEEMEKHF
jgi:predicted  nucleic acid-binding Zn-ribbon protein